MKDARPPGASGLVSNAKNSAPETGYRFVPEEGYVAEMHRMSGCEGGFLSEASSPKRGALLFLVALTLPVARTFPDIVGPTVWTPCTEIRMNRDKSLVFAAQVNYPLWRHFVMPRKKAEVH